MEKFLESIKVDVKEFDKILPYIKSDRGHMLIEDESGKNYLNFHRIGIDKYNKIMWLEQITAKGPRFFECDLDLEITEMIKEALTHFNGDSLYKRIS